MGNLQKVGRRLLQATVPVTGNDTNEMMMMMIVIIIKIPYF